MKAKISKPTGRFEILVLILLTCLALLLRLQSLGNTFPSSDNALPAFQIVTNPGYGWMLHERYGFLVYFLVKIFVGAVSSVGITVTEFWWKAPIALLGTLQTPLTFLFIKRLGGREEAALSGSALISILPIHVMQSRYLCGYEVLGVLFVTLAIWSLLDFFDRPTLKRGLVASFFLGLYLISHGYVLPVVFCLVSMLTIFPRGGARTPLGKLKWGLYLFVTRWVWLFPALFSRVCFYSLAHSVSKPTAFGVYLSQHLPRFIENVGILIFVFLIVTVLIGLFSKRASSNETLLLVTCGAAYLAPLFFAAPPGITMVRGYMLMGTFFLVLNMAIVTGELATRRKKLLAFLICVCFLVTLWGTIESIWGRDQGFDPTLVEIERGGLPPDPGSKAAGYLLRKYLSDSASVLSIHRQVEPPNMLYYFGRLEYAYYDLSLEQSIEKFLQQRKEIDVVICDAEQMPSVESDDGFERRIVLFSEGVPRMWIYARPGVELPAIRADVVALNRAFDKEYAWRVTLR
jgi:hypothetical protein